MTQKSLEKLERGINGLFMCACHISDRSRMRSLSNSKRKAIAIIKLGWNEGMNYFLDVSRWESVLSLCEDPHRKTMSACHFKPFFLWNQLHIRGASLKLSACVPVGLVTFETVIFQKKLAQVYLTLLHLMELKLIAVVLETFLLSWWQSFGLSTIILQISLWNAFI